MYCLDTNIIIDIFHGNKELALKINNLKEEYIGIFITPITLCELYKGVFLFFNLEKGVKQIDDFILSFSVLNFDIDSCKEYGKQYARLKKQGKLTMESDLMIGCITKVNNLILITRDKKDFLNIEGLKLEVW